MNSTLFTLLNDVKIFKRLKTKIFFEMNSYQIFMISKYISEVISIDIILWFNIFLNIFDVLIINKILIVLFSIIFIIDILNVMAVKNFPKLTIFVLNRYQGNEVIKKFL